MTVHQHGEPHAKSLSHRLPARQAVVIYGPPDRPKHLTRLKVVVSTWLSLECHVELHRSQSLDILNVLRTDDLLLLTASRFIDNHESHIGARWVQQQLKHPRFTGKNDLGLSYPSLRFKSDILDRRELDRPPEPVPQHTSHEAPRGHLELQSFIQSTGIEPHSHAEQPLQMIRFRIHLVLLSVDQPLAYDLSTVVGHGPPIVRNTARPRKIDNGRPRTASDSALVAFKLITTSARVQSNWMTSTPPLMAFEDARPENVRGGLSASPVDGTSS